MNLRAYFFNALNAIAFPKFCKTASVNTPEFDRLIAIRETISPNAVKKSLFNRVLRENMH